MAETIAEQVLRQFAANFSAALPPQPSSAASAPGGGGEQAASGEMGAVNGFALLRAIVSGWLRALFRWGRA
jgi:hypothetical protein